MVCFNSLLPLLHNEVRLLSFQAAWTLQTTLKLPWRPFIDVIGATEYTLNADANQVQLPTHVFHCQADESCSHFDH